MICRWIPRLALLIGLSACGARTDAQTLRSALDHQLARNAQRYGIAGQAVLILRNGKTVYRSSHGLARRETNQPVHPEDIFPAFSLSKLFSSVLVMQLVEQGRLDLETPIAHYLPALPTSWRNITVNEILNHVSGLPEYFDASRRPIVLPPTRDAVFAALAEQPLQFPTATSTSYNQTNFVVLGAILEAEYGMPYRKIVTERIIEPLGLSHTYLGKAQLPQGGVVHGYIGKDHRLIADEEIDWPEYAVAHAELYTTIDDLGTFLNALCEGRLLEPDTLVRLWRPYRLRQGDVGWFASGWEYGTRGGYQHVGHDGGTKVRVRLLFRDSLSQDTYTFVYLTNGSAENVWSRTLIESLMAVTAPDAFRD